MDLSSLPLSERVATAKKVLTRAFADCQLARQQNLPATQLSPDQEAILAYLPPQQAQGSRARMHEEAKDLAARQGSGIDEIWAQAIATCVHTWGQDAVNQVLAEMQASEQG